MGSVGLLRDYSLRRIKKFIKAHFCLAGDF